MYIDYYIFKHAEHENKGFKSITQKTKKLWTFILNFFIREVKNLVFWWSMVMHLDCEIL